MKSYNEFVQEKFDYTKQNIKTFSNMKEGDYVYVLYKKSKIEKLQIEYVMWCDYTTIVGIKDLNNSYIEIPYGKKDGDEWKNDTIDYGSVFYNFKNLKKLENKMCVFSVSEDDILQYLKN